MEPKELPTKVYFKLIDHTSNMCVVEGDNLVQRSNNDFKNTKLWPFDLNITPCDNEIISYIFQNSNLIQKDWSLIFVAHLKVLNIFCNALFCEKLIGCSLIQYVMTFLKRDKITYNYLRLFNGLKGHSNADFNARLEEAFGLILTILYFSKKNPVEQRQVFLHILILLLKIHFIFLIILFFRIFSNIEYEIYKIKIQKLPLKSKLDLVNNRLHIFDVDVDGVFDIDEIIMNNFKKNLTKLLSAAANDSLAFKYQNMVFFSEHTFSQHFPKFNDKKLVDQFSNNPPATQKPTHIKYDKIPNKAPKQKNDIFDIEDLDKIAKQNFPLCMRLAHEKLKQDHKLKNLGRIIYYSFMNKTEISYKDLYSYLKKEHEKIMPPAEFESKYKNCIKYYTTGNKKSYNCNAIFKLGERLSDGCIGCPYKLYDANTLVQKMELLNFDQIFIKHIESMHREKKHTPQEMCLEYYNYTNNTNSNFVIYHPNVYYNNSRKLNNN